MIKLRNVLVLILFLSLSSCSYVHGCERKIVYSSLDESGGAFIIQSKSGRKGDFLLHSSDESVSHSFGLVKFRVNLKKLKKGIYYKDGKVYIEGDEKTCVCIASEKDWSNIVKATEGWSSHHKVYVYD